MLMLNLMKIKRKITRDNLNLLKEFNAIEGEKKGHVTLIQFQYIMNNFLDLEQDEIQKITNFIIERKRSGWAKETGESFKVDK